MGRMTQPLAELRADAVRILGPLDVTAHGEPVPIGGERQRALLGLLALRANQVVTFDELIEALFAGGGSGALHTAVSRLRRVIGPDWIETHPFGYSLSADESRLDALEAREAAARAAALDDLPARADSLRGAAELWRGPVLGDVDVPASFRADVQRLDELHRTVVGERIEAELALGRHADVVGELDALAAAHPFDERIRRQLALALYRSGRQVDALNTLGDYAARIRDELGLEPSAELRELERAILNHDAALLLEQEPAGSARSMPGHRVGRLVFALVIVAVLGAALAVALVVRSRPAGVPFTQLQPGTLAAARPGSDRAQRTFDVGRVPRAVSVGYGAAWVVDFRDETVSRVPVDGSEITTVGLGVTPTGVVAGAGGVWVISAEAGTVIRIEPSTGRVLARVPLAPGLTDIAAGEASVWVSNADSGTVTRINARRSEPVLHVSGLRDPSGLVVVGADVWVAERSGRRLRRIDARSGTVADTIPVDLTPGDLAATEGVIWAANPTASAVTRLDTAARTSRVISVGRFPSVVAAEGGTVVVLNDQDHSLSVISARTGQVESTVTLSDRVTQEPGQITPGGLAVVHGKLWVTVHGY
jgi:DNA-binding SARP family transcriptional activator/DNA-binding beta-propeller fold protein YncE